MDNLFAINSANFEQVISHHDLVLIDFWASWCQPCLAFAPIFEQVAKEHPAITFGKVNIEEAQDLAAEFAIRSIPTLMVFRQKILLFNESGVLPAPAVKDLIEQAKALNMAEIVTKLKQGH